MIIDTIDTKKESDDSEFEAAVSNDLKHFCTISSSEVWFDL